MDRERPVAAASAAEAQEEIRQSSRRSRTAGRPAAGGPNRHRRGGGLAHPRPQPGDPGLRDEVRQLVIARNERRLRQGKDPLDVEAEVNRQLRDLGAMN